MNCESWVREKRKQAQHMAAKCRKYAANTDDMAERIRRTAEADIWRMEAGDMQEILASADDADHGTGHGLTVERLLCAFYNVNPCMTSITLKRSEKDTIVSDAHWSVAFLERYDGLIGPRRECGFFFCPWGCGWHIRHGKPCQHQNECYCMYD